MTNLRIYTEYPEGVNDHKGLVDYVANGMFNNSTGITISAGLVIYDKVADKVAIAHMTQIVTPA